MILIVGLGNPGRKFKKTRHNLGFCVVDTLRKENNFPKFKLSKKIKAEISEGMKENEKIVLVKPQTFMNQSGQAVKKILKKRFKIERSSHFEPDIYVVHDDIDLPLGTMKLVKNQGAAGHKGVQSIIESLGTKDFIRVRLGIKPEQKPNCLDKFVLQKFTRDENKIIKESVKKAAQGIKLAIIKGFAKI